jgi:hypothetical protein
LQEGHLAKINIAFAQSYPLLLWIILRADSWCGAAIFPPGGLWRQADSLAQAVG